MHAHNDGQTEPYRNQNDADSDGGTMTFRCGCLGCDRAASVRIRHPEHGIRTVCDDHIDNFRILGFVEGGGGE